MPPIGKGFTRLLSQYSDSHTTCANQEAEASKLFVTTARFCENTDTTIA